MIGKSGLLSVAALAVCAACSSGAFAGPLQIAVSDSLGRSLLVIDGGLGDQDLLANTVNIDGNVLLAAFPELDFGSAVNASSNFTGGSSGADLFRRLAQANTLIRDDVLGAALISYTIVASQIDFLLPTGPFRIVTDTASGSFNNADSSNTVTFEGGVDGGNALNAITTSAGLLGPFSSIQLTPNSFAGSAGPVAFTDAGTYSITNRTVIETAVNAEVLTTSAVRVDALEEVPDVVPEPSGLILMLLGGVGVLGGWRSRRGRRMVDEPE